MKFVFIKYQLTGLIYFVFIFVQILKQKYWPFTNKVTLISCSMVEQITKLKCLTLFYFDSIKNNMQTIANLVLYLFWHELTKN